MVITLVANYQDEEFLTKINDHTKTDIQEVKKEDVRKLIEVKK